MKKSLLIGLSVGVPIILIGLLVVHVFFYPLVSVSPNYEDVEAVYNKMVVPETWVKKGEGANKGLAGRRCPTFESDGCFSKVASYTVPVGTGEDVVKFVYESMGCPSVVADRTVQTGGVTYTDFECSAGVVYPYGTLTEEGDGVWSLTIGVSSK